MPTLTLLDNEYIGLWFHTDSKIVHHQMRRFVPSEAFRQALDMGAAHLEQHGARCWLSDDSGNTAAVSQADIEWGDTTWAPRVIRAGLKYWAIVMPRQAIGRMQMRKLIAEYKERGVEVQAFATPEAAMTWLKSMSS